MVEEKKPNSLFIFIRKVFYVYITILQSQNLEALGQDVKRCRGIRLRLRKDSELVKVDSLTENYEGGVGVY